MNGEHTTKRERTYKQGVNYDFVLPACQWQSPRFTLDANKELPAASVTANPALVRCANNHPWYNLSVCPTPVQPKEVRKALSGCLPTRSRRMYACLSAVILLQALTAGGRPDHVSNLHVLTNSTYRQSKS